MPLCALSPIRGPSVGVGTIETDKRLKAAELLEGFLEGVLSNDEFEDNWPQSASDIALEQIAHHLSGTYDDMKEYRLIPDQIDPELAATYRRSILFLRGSMEYSWPRQKTVGFIDILLAMVTLGLVGLSKGAGRRRFAMAGDLTAWPFLSKEDFDRAARDA